MDQIEKNLQEAAAELATIPRQGGGVNVTSAQRLKLALREAAEAWADSDVISKSAANLFVDLASSLGAMSHAYDSPERDRIRTLADEIADLVRCVTLTEMET